MAAWLASDLLPARRLGQRTGACHFSALRGVRRARPRRMPLQAKAVWQVAEVAVSTAEETEVVMEAVRVVGMAVMEWPTD